MLGVKTYSRDYIDATRARVRSDVAAFEALVSSAKSSGNALNEVRVLCQSILEHGGV